MVFLIFKRFFKGVTAGGNRICIEILLILTILVKKKKKKK